MQPFKAKVEKSIGHTPTLFPEANSARFAKGIRIQAVFYDNPNLDQHVFLFDKDGDPCFIQIPGQAVPHLIEMQTPITVHGPLTYIDEDPNGGHKIIVFGEEI